MADHQEATITLPSAPASVTAARRFATGVVAEWGLPDEGDALDSLRLIVSELATNAVQHAQDHSPTFQLDVRLDGADKVCVGVTDRHPREPRRLPAAVQQDNGRGLVIVRALTAEAGGKLTVTPAEEGGKTVWATFPWAPPAPVPAQ